MTKEAVLNELQKRVEVVVQEINNTSYYTHIWDKVAHKKSLKECTRAELLKPFQDFWEQLPDSNSIRHGAFFNVCDLAEAYCYGDSDDGIDD